MVKVLSKEQKAAGEVRYPPTGFGARLRALRTAAGITGVELGRRSGVTANSLSRLERGVYEPAWPVVLAVAVALGVPTDAFRPITEAPAQAEGLPAPEGAKPRRKPRKTKGADAGPAV